MTNRLFNGMIIAFWLASILYVGRLFYKLAQEERCFYSPELKKKHFVILFPLIQLYKRNAFQTRAHIIDCLRTCRQRTEPVMLRYMTGAFIFMGLLGTLWGLSQTIVLIADVIAHLPTQGVSENFFEVLKDQLQKPLSGMGIAFGSSFFGVAGSLTLGFVFMQLEQARRAFFQKAQEWAFVFFKLNDEFVLKEESKPFPEALFMRCLDNMDKLMHFQASYEKHHQHFCDTLLNLAEKTQTLAELMKTQHFLLSKWAEEQMQNRHTLERVTQKMEHLPFSGDEAMKNYLAQIAVSCQEFLKILSYDLGKTTRELHIINRPVPDTSHK